MVLVVVDTKVLVSALINRGKPRRFVLKLLEEYTLILSHQILTELAEVLMGDKFAVKTSQVDRFLAILVRKAKKVTPSSRFIVISEDPDNVVLNKAYAGKAEYIITGDRHLLALKEFKRTKIVKGTHLLESLR